MSKRRNSPRKRLIETLLDEHFLFRPVPLDELRWVCYRHERTGTGTEVLTAGYRKSFLRTLREHCEGVTCTPFLASSLSVGLLSRFAVFRQEAAHSISGFLAAKFDCHVEIRRVSFRSSASAGRLLSGFACAIRSTDELVGTQRVDVGGVFSDRESSVLIPSNAKLIVVSEMPPNEEELAAMSSVPWRIARPGMPAIDMDPRTPVRDLHAD